MQQAYILISELLNNTEKIQKINKRMISLSKTKKNTKISKTVLLGYRFIMIISKVKVKNDFFKPYKIKCFRRNI